MANSTKKDNVGLNLGQLESALENALEGQLGNIKITPLMRAQKNRDRVSQRYILYYSITGGILTNRAGTASIECPKAKKVAYNLTFVFNLLDLRTHKRFYDCADELLGLIDGLPLESPFTQISVIEFSEPTWEEEGGFYEWTIKARVYGYFKTNMLMQQTTDVICHGD